jgi:Methane oxygenase PmoA
MTESQQLHCAGQAVAGYVVQPELALDLSPRPYLHPVTTLRGVTVTDALPRDHPWHLGVSVALQHVVVGDQAPLNFWGGRTYVRDGDYTWLDDHGRIEHVAWTDRRPDRIGQELAWQVPGQSPDVSTVLRERRTLTASYVRLPFGTRLEEQAWALGVDFALTNATAQPVSLGSPGSMGRPAAGYGGFFWRAPASPAGVRVATPQQQGEDAVHGQPAEWLLFSGGDAGTGRPWSLLMAGQDAATRADPWFVRVRDYPGVGSALAYERPVVLNPGEIVQRSLMVIVLDGILGTDEAPAVLAAAGGN